MMMASAVSFISRPSIFLPRYSGVRPTISPQMNTARMAYRIMFMRPTPLPPKTQLSIMCSIGTIPPNGRQGVVHVVDGACGEGCCYGGKQSGLGDAEADFLALHAACGLVEADLRQSRVALQLSPVAKAQANQEQIPMAKKMLRPSLPSSRAVMPSGWADSIFSRVESF